MENNTTTINGFNETEVHKLYEFLVKFENYQRNKSKNINLTQINNHLNISYGTYEQISNYEKKPIPTELKATRIDSYHLLKNFRESIAHAYIEKINKMVVVKNYESPVSSRKKIYGEIPENDFFKVLDIMIAAL